MSVSDSPKRLKESLLQGHKVDPGTVTRWRMKTRQDHTHTPHQAEEHVCLEQRMETKIYTLT